MIRRLVALICLPALCSVALCGQVKSYSSYEDYCADNPHAPTCTNGKPLKVQPLTMPHTPGAGSDYCAKHLDQPMCANYCRDNPNAATCKDRASNPSGNTSQQQQQPWMPGSRSHPGPQMTVVNYGPESRASAAAGKPLLLPADWRFAHPHADVLLGINATALRQSPTLQAVLKQLAPSLKMTPDDIESALDETTGVDQYLISVHSGDVLMLLQGAQITAPPAPVRLNNGMLAYGVTKNSVLVGHDASASAANQRAHGAASAAALQMKAQAVGNEVWVMGTRATLNKANVPLPELAEGLSSYLLGVSLRDGIKAELKLNYASPTAARRALASVQKSPMPREWPVHISSELAGSSVRLRVAVAQLEISQALAKALASPNAKPVLELIAHNLQTSGEMVVYGPEGPKTIHTTPTAAPPPGKLVIYGLPSGPKVM